MMHLNFSKARWLNKPEVFEVCDHVIKILTEPGTDFWQRSYYGFSNDNAPALLLESRVNFTFTARVSFKYKTRFDQCGLVIYFDSDNWFKASVEHENLNVSRLGTVVTNHGYSDWATTDILPTSKMWFRLHRRGPDFLIESSTDGREFQQMRIFHLHFLGETSPEISENNLSPPPIHPIQFGFYACSPQDSSFEATFDSYQLENCQWSAH